MRFLDLTLGNPPADVALDEALLDEAESSPEPVEILRLWEPRQSMVVIGRSSRIAAEVNQPECDRLGIPILRRASGGAAVLTGRGCLMYAVVLSYELRPALRSIEAAHQFVLDTLSEAVRTLVPEVTRRGTSDLALRDRKFSGNSLRCKRTHLLYHGTLLYDFPTLLIGQCLGTPPRQPDYRGGRGHTDFVTNLPVDGQRLRAALTAQWRPIGNLETWPSARTHALVAERYSQAAWTTRL